MTPLPDLEPTEVEQLQADVDAVIASCDGDPRAAVAALIVSNAHLERELELALAAVSHGYSRGWHARRE